MTTATGIRSRWQEVPADTVSDAMVAAMAMAGVERIWFVSGTELAHFQEATTKAKVLGRKSPKLMTMTHENAALAAACGETAVTGKPSVAVFHVDNGLLNAGAAIHNADRGHYPVLMMSGYPPSAEPGSMPGARDSFIQWFQQVPDQGAIVRQYTRWDHKLAPYDNPGLVITRAFQVALSEPQGPAYLAVPREVAMGSIEGGSVRFPTLSELRPAGSAAADPSLLREAAKYLLQAQNPVIIASKAGRNPSAVAALAELAQTVAAPVMAEPFKLNLPDRHPLYRGSPNGGALPPNCDCALVIDTVVPWMPGKSEPLADAKIIRIDIDPVERMTPVYDFPCDLSITADSSKAIPALLEEVRSKMTAEQKQACEERLARLQDEGRERLARIRDAAYRDAESGKVTPRWVTFQMGEVIPPEARIFHEMTDASMFNRTQPGTLMGTGGSSIGWSAPAALGAKAATPDRPVIAAVGDGAWMFSNPQVVLWASRFHKAPVLFLVMNNRGYRTGTDTLLQQHPEGYAVKANDFNGGWFDPTPEFAAEAAASGAYGEKVVDPEEVAGALKRGLDAVEKGGVPAVVEFWLPKLVTGEV